MLSPLPLSLPTPALLIAPSLSKERKKKRERRTTTVFGAYCPPPPRLWVASAYRHLPGSSPGRDPAFGPQPSHTHPLGLRGEEGASPPPAAQSKRPAVVLSDTPCSVPSFRYSLKMPSMWRASWTKARLQVLLALGEEGAGPRVCSVFRSRSPAAPEGANSAQSLKTHSGLWLLGLGLGSDGAAGAPAQGWVAAGCPHRAVFPEGGGRGRLAAVSA